MSDEVRDLNNEHDEDDTPLGPGAEDEVLKAHTPDKTVKVEGDEGQVTEYLVVEMSGEDLATWMEIVTRRIPTDNKGRLTRKPKYEGLHNDLLFLAMRNKDRSRVSKRLIASWGTKLKNTLFAKCQDHNGLTDDAIAREGKD